MAPCPPAPEALWSFLWGKRRSRRHAVALRAEITVAGKTAAARALDLSAHGVLLEVAEGDLRGLGASGSGRGASDLASLLAGALRVRFPGRRTAIDATAIRVAWRPDGSGHLCLGCSFHRPLNTLEIRRLGLSPHALGPESGVEALPSSRMPLQADPERPLRLQVGFGDRDPWSGPLVAASGKAVATRFEELEPTEVVARLSRHQLSLLVNGVAGVRWTSPAYLLAVRLPESPGSGSVEVVLLANAAPPAAVTRHLRRQA